MRCTDTKSTWRLIRSTAKKSAAKESIGKRSRWYVSSSPPRLLRKIFGTRPAVSCLAVWALGIGALGLQCPGHGVFGQEVPAAQEGTPEVTLENVRKILRQLEANQLQQRDQAEKQLVELGVGVLPFLPEVNARTSGEMKVRLQRIRQALQQSDMETFFEASRVTLQGKMKLTEAIEKISEQTGNTIQLQGEDAMTGVDVELDVEDEDFWVAMERIMSHANLRINAFGSTEGDLVLAAGGPDASEEKPLPFSTGPFRVDVISVQSSLPFNSPIGGQLDLSFQVTWEPRMKPVFMQIPMESVEATLPDGDSLSATNPQAAPEIALNLGGCSTQVDLQLQRPARSEDRIDKLTGEFVIAVPSDRHQYVFEKFGSGARQSEKFGDVTVTLEGARRNGAVYEMRVLVEFGNAQGALDSFRGWILSNEAYLLDAKEARLENVGLQTYAVTQNAVGIAYLFQINGDPNDHKLIYESPGVITKQKVAYELENIELP